MRFDTSKIRQLRGTVAISVALGACGGAATSTPAAGIDPLTTEVVLATGSTEPPVAVVTPTCPWDLEAQRALAPDVTAAFGDLSPGSVRTVWASDGSGDALSASFEARSTQGREAGSAEYLCTPAGLGLRRVSSTTGAISFVPAVVVLPGELGEGRAAGAAAIRSGDVDRALDYEFTWSATEAGPPPALATLEARFVEVRSTLTLNDPETRRSWQTTTRWAIGDGYFFVVLFDQIVTQGDQVATHNEHAETFYFSGADR